LKCECTGGERVKAQELDSFKKLLLQKRELLSGNMSSLESQALKRSRQESSGDLSNMPIHMADIGSDNFEQEFTLSLMETEGGTLERIESALERMEDGTYSECEECGSKIPKKRLDAIPYAAMCIKCASRLEQGL
jgi:RNA polymerase-binding protein DksA